MKKVFTAILALVLVFSFGKANACTNFLITNAISDNKRQQTTTVDYKRLINGLVLTGFASLQRKTL